MSSDLQKALSHQRLLIAVAGPTATGKSALALAAAKRYGGEIVNCDSMQMVRGLDIGTAKPTREERKIVPHHLFDIVDPNDLFSAGDYVNRARPLCREISRRGRIPFVVGGTGLYLRVLLEGIFSGPGRSEEIRERLETIAEKRGAAALHTILTEHDPVAAAEIEKNDAVRIIRALEVYMLTGERISDLQRDRSGLESFVHFKVAIRLPRENLYGRINRRVERMFESGLLEEVQTLLEAGYPPSAKGFEALGYRQAISVLRGELSREEAVERTQRATRRYAKRQLTWFRKEEGLHWIEGPGDDPEVLEQFEKLLRQKVEG